MTPERAELFLALYRHAVQFEGLRLSPGMKVQIERYKYIVAHPNPTNQYHFPDSISPRRSNDRRN